MKNKLCLFDMDGTLCDHTGALMRDLALIQSPNDPVIKRHDDDELPWAKERKRLIRSQPDWWYNLDRIKAGFDIYHLVRSFGFQIYVLTKGPWTCANAWSEKVKWCRKHLSDDIKIVISEDKSIVYGRVLVDDYVPYIMGWLNHRPRGLAIMVANEENKDYMAEAEKYCRKIQNSSFLHGFEKAEKEGRIFRYDIDSLSYEEDYKEIKSKLQYAFERE